MLDDEQIIKLSDSIRISTFDINSNNKKYLVEHVNGKKYEISEVLYQVISLIDGKSSINEISENFEKKYSRYCTPSQINKIIDEFLLKRGLIDSYESEEKEQPAFSNLIVKLPLFSQEFIHPLTNVLKHFFDKYLFITLMVSIILFHFYFYFIFDKHPQFSLEVMHPENVFVIYIVSLVSILFHELGHSSACAKFGGQHGEIGIGIYIYFPVFYSDVSDIWRLRRMERAVVDFGGIYFQLLTLPVLLFLFYAKPDDTFIYAIYMIDYSLITNLNPFFKFDGYWFFSDLLGLSNLRKHSNEIVEYWIKKNILRKNTVLPPKNDLKPKILKWLKVYIVMSNIFFLYVTYRLLLLFPVMLKEYPGHLKKAVSNIIMSIHNSNYGAVAIQYIHVVFSTLFLVSYFLLVYRLIFLIKSKNFSS